MEVPLSFGTIVYASDLLKHRDCTQSRKIARWTREQQRHLWREDITGPTKLKRMMVSENLHDAKTLPSRR